MHTPEKANSFMFFLIVFFISGQIIYGFTLSALGIGIGDVPIWLMVTIMQVGLIGIPCAIYLIVHRKNIKEILPLRPLGLVNVLMVTGMSIAIYPMILLIGAIFGAIFGAPSSYTLEGFADESSIWVMLVLIPVLPSIFEELALRGIVFSGYKNVKIFTAALVNGVFFGIIHLNFHQFSFAFVLGFIMCYMMWYTKSLWAPVLSHFVINATGTLLLYIGRDIDMEGLVDEVGYAASGADLAAFQELMDGIVFLGAFALVFFGLFIVIYRAFKRHNLERNQASGMATDTYVHAQRERVLTWGLIATVVLGFVMMILAAL